ncbi:chain length determinant protein EpsF [Methylomagnum ishizawai]|uniref:Chain length determinant protein EpsF n=1 Tax=Methylomagnum ishizawai TaxID=1760988 RepID=A0A1Y6CSR0_9GAMM|nr:chain length determinant protein EpsF [Methylomagnum ishizawai]SMF93356.1 chain length determinant protein EpsF [Methylomagnum ishizawai]
MTYTQMFLILAARWRAVLAVFLGVVGLVAGLSWALPKTYTARASVLVDFKGVDPITGMILPGQLLTGYLATQVDIITSHAVALRVVDSLKLTEVPELVEKFDQETEGRGSVRDWVADRLVKYLDARPGRDSSVIAIEFSSTDPDFAAGVANAFARAYIQTNLDLRVDPARTQASWFEDQIKNLRGQVEAARQRLSEYQRRTGIVASDEKLDVENARLAELSSQWVIAQTQTYDIQTRQRQVAEAEAKGRLEELPDIQGNALIQNLKHALAQSEAKLAETADQLGPKHPVHQSARAERDSLKRKIAAEIQNVKGSLAHAAAQAQQRETQIEHALDRQKNRVLELKEGRDRAMVLTHEVENAERAYDSARQRTEQIRLESQRSQTEIAVLNSAVPPLWPSKPRLALNLAIGVVMGVLFGVACALLREVFDRRVRAEDDIGRGLGVPVLVSIAPGRTRRPALGFLQKPALPPRGGPYP